jgi:hypothetical protein
MARTNLAPPKFAIGTKWTIQPRPRLSALGQEQALGGNSTEWIGSDWPVAFQQLLDCALKKIS